jgi:hypothetical protein
MKKLNLKGVQYEDVMQEVYIGSSGIGDCSGFPDGDKRLQKERSRSASCTAEKDHTRTK